MDSHAEGEEEDPKDDDPILETEELEPPKKKPAIATNKKAASKKSAPQRGEIVQSIDKPNGWKLLQYRTPKGRLYWKWVAADGEYFFSKTKAVSYGYKE